MKIFISILITIILGLLVLSIQDPVFLAGGSDSLDIVVLPNLISQAIALVLFFFSLLHLLKVKYDNKQLGFTIKSLLFVFAFIMVLFSGHTYTISGKQHAFIDQWFHVPVQTLEFDPTGSIESFKYKDEGLFISVYDGDEIRQKIITGPLYWGVSGEDVIEKLEKFGIVKK